MRSAPSMLPTKFLWGLHRNQLILRVVDAKATECHLERSGLTVEVAQLLVDRHIEGHGGRCRRRGGGRRWRWTQGRRRVADGQQGGRGGPSRGDLVGGRREYRDRAGHKCQQR